MSNTARDRSRKRGRPVLAPEQRKRNNVTIRLRDSLKSGLQEAGVTEGRSLSEEIEFRLERSFLVEDHLALICSDPRISSFAMDLLEAKRLIESHQENSVWDDFECHEAMKAALKRLFAQQKTPQPTGKFKKRMASYERYAERELKPWRERGGGLGLLSNSDAGPQPTLKPSPVDHARALGRAAVDVVTKDRRMALVEVLKAGGPKED